MKKSSQLEEGAKEILVVEVFTTYLKWILGGILVGLVSLALFASKHADGQTTQPASWPVCRLGKAPVAPGPPPTEAVVFPAKGGPVIMSEAGTAGAVRLIRCNLPADTPSYRGADGVLRDVASNQPYWPVKWDAIPASIPVPRDGIDGQPGPRGPRGFPGINGVGTPGPRGLPGRDAVVPPPSPVVKKGHGKLVGILVAVGVTAAVAVVASTRGGKNQQTVVVNVNTTTPAPSPGGIGVVTNPPTGGPGGH